MSDAISNEQIKADLGVDDISVGERADDDVVHKIVVDRVSCIGARSCVVVAEKVFQMDDENLAYVTEDVNSTDIETIKLAAQSCPVLAIHLYNKTGKKIFPEA